VNAAMLENVDGMLKLFVENQEIVMVRRILFMAADLRSEHTQDAKF